jgi:SAM-dependent methyltransferase
MQNSIFRQMLEIAKQKYPNFAVVWEESLNEFGADWESEFNESVRLLFGDKMENWGEAIDGYAEFCTDALRSQIYFERNGKYKASSYAEVAEACYHNEDFMLRCYLPGMFLSHYIWPHHHRMLQYFRSLTPYFKDIKTYAEVGTGCGMYSKEPLMLVPGCQGVGYDISRHALDFTFRVVKAFGAGQRYRTEVRDIIADTPPESDMVICQEVLEHLEDPATFVKCLFKMTAPGGIAYISAAINAGHVDHIYLYRDKEEVAEQLLDAGFEIIDSRAEFAYEGKPLEVTPCHGSFLCRRAG